MSLQSRRMAWVYPQVDRRREFRGCYLRRNIPGEEDEFEVHMILCQERAKCTALRVTFFVRFRLLNSRKSVFVFLTPPKLWLALASSSGPKPRMKPPRDSAKKGAIGKASRFELFLCAPLGDVRLRSNVDLLRPSLQKWRAMPLGCRQLPPAWPLRAPRHGAGGPTRPSLAERRVREADQERLL